MIRVGENWLSTVNIETKHFDDALVQGTAEMIRRWQPQPRPTWITCVSSLTRPKLVPNFAQRLADKLGLPFKSVVHQSQR